MQRHLSYGISLIAAKNYTHWPQLYRLCRMRNQNQRQCRPWAAVVLIAFAIASGLAQETPPATKFDVSSVKLVTTLRDGSRTNVEHGSLTATNITIRALIRLAFDVRDYQILNAPGWID